MTINPATDTRAFQNIAATFDFSKFSFNARTPNVRRVATKILRKNPFTRDFYRVLTAQA